MNKLLVSVRSTFSGFSLPTSSRSLAWCSGGYNFGFHGRRYLLVGHFCDGKGAS